MKPDSIQSIAVVITTKIACPKTCHQLVIFIISEHFYNKANVRNQAWHKNNSSKNQQVVKILPEARVIRTVGHIQDTGHLPCRVGLHLNQKISNDLSHNIFIRDGQTCSNRDSRFIHLASQKLISARGPGVFPSASSAALSLLRTSSVW